MKIFKTVLAILMILVMGACTNKEAVNIEELRIMYAPLTEVDDILSMTRDLGYDLQKEMASRGFNIEKVTITVAPSVEDAALALLENRVDLAWISAVEYCRYSDKLGLLAAGTLPELTVNSAKPVDWNTGYDVTDEKTASYRTLIITTNRELIAKFDAGEKLKWEDISNLTWALRESRYSPDGFMAAAKWLSDEFGQAMTDIKYLRVSDSYRITALFNGEADIAAINGYKLLLANSHSRDTDLTALYRVIGVADKFAYDPLCYNSNNEILKDRRMRKALIEVLESLENMYRYNYSGIKDISDSEYKAMKKALNIIDELN